MLELILLFSIVAIALLVMRVGTLALQKTGMSREAAGFQAQSAFMGVGFTTAEAESVMKHPVRRRIVRILMWLGFGSITSVLGTLVVTFATPTATNLSQSSRLGVITGGLLALWVIWRFGPLERLLDRVISHALEHMTELKIVDYEAVLKLDKGFTIATIQIEPGSWLSERSLHDLELSREGVLVLNVSRPSGTTLATPHSSTVLGVGDKLLCYGVEDVLEHLANRMKDEEGDHIHELNIRRQKLRVAGEKVEDEVQSSEG